MEKGVHGRFLDQSTSVREAAIELVGKFILVRPELTSQYYPMLSERILVSTTIDGVSNNPRKLWPKYKHFPHAQVVVNQFQFQLDNIFIHLMLYI